MASTNFRKSSFSNPRGECVEVAFGPDGEVFVRDTKDDGVGPVLEFTAGEWDAFLKGVRNNEFDTV